MTQAGSAAAPVAPVCAVTGARKSYGGVKALTGVDLEVYPGRVHAVVGENGAGKSTLMKILAGAEQPDAGDVTIKGERVALGNVAAANRHGVAIVFQELSLFPDLDVLQNVFLARPPRRFGCASRREMRRQARPVLEAIGLEVGLDAPIGALSVDERQLIEIAKALLADAEIVILDEPTSALNAAESERLFGVVRRLRERGVAVIYISHRLEEVFQISDVITVMRDGSIVTTVDVASTSIPEIVAAMIGRKPSEPIDRMRRTSLGPPLHVEALTVDGRVHDLSLVAAPGEIVGLAGLEGSGVGTVFDVLFGVGSPDAGRVRLPDQSPAPRSVPAAVRRGIARVPADRRSDGLMLDQSVLTNISHVSAGVLGRQGFVLRRRRLEQRAAARRDALQIKAASLDAPVGHLSGGNQQKVVLAKWLEAEPQLLLLDDPTRGVDVGAKMEIYRIIEDLAAKGHIILFSSSEHQEYVRLCDRVIVLYQGRCAGELAGEALTEHRILEAINTGRV